MWTAILIGFGTALIFLLVYIFRHEARYRSLLSDGHLLALSQQLEAAEVAPNYSKEGLRLHWKPLASERKALMLSSKKTLAPTVAAFILALFLAHAKEEAGPPEEDSTSNAKDSPYIQLDKKNFALLWPVPLKGQSPSLKAISQGLRERAIAAMHEEPMVKGSLLPYED